MVALLKLEVKSGVNVTVITTDPPFRAEPEEPEMLKMLESLEINVQVPATTLELYVALGRNVVEFPMIRFKSPKPFISGSVLPFTIKLEVTGGAEK